MASSCKRRIYTNDKLGFRQDLDTWRSKLIVCVGAEKILELLESRILEDITQFKDCKPASVSNWSFDESCLFCCLRREKVKEHVTALNTKIVESGGKPLLGKDHGHISRLEGQVEEFINAVLQRKDYAPRIPDPHIPVVACDTMQQMINHLVAHSTSNNSQDSPYHNGMDQSLLKTHSSPSAITVATPTAAAFTKSPVLGKLLMEDQDAPLDLSVKKGRQESSRQDGVLDLSMKKNCNSDNIPFGSPHVNLTPPPDRQTPSFGKARGLQSVSTLEQFMAKLCLPHQRQIVDAFGFLQSEMKSVTCSREVSTPSVLERTMDSNCAEKSSGTPPTEENLPAAGVTNGGKESPVYKNDEVLPSNQPLENDGPVIASTKIGSFTGSGRADIRDDDKESVEGKSPNIQPKGPTLMIQKNHLEEKMSEVGPIILQHNTSTSEQDQSASDEQSHTNGTDNDTVVLSPCSISHGDTDPILLPVHRNDVPVQPCSIQRTTNAISLSSSKTAKRRSRGCYSQSRPGLIGNMIKDPDIKYDIVYVGKPITECKLHTRNHMRPRKTARKSTRGHLTFGDCWEIKTVRTLARRSTENSSGNYPVPMPDITTLITPKQAPAKPEGLPAMSVPFTGDCMETVMCKNLSDQSAVTEIPGDVVELPSEELIVEPSQTGQTLQNDQTPSLVSDEERDPFENQDSTLGAHDISESSETPPNSISETSEKMEFTTKEIIDAPALISGGSETEVRGQNQTTEALPNTDVTSIENDASKAEILRSGSDLRTSNQAKCLSLHVTCTNNSTMLEKTCGTETNLNAGDSENVNKDEFESNISAVVVEEMAIKDQVDNRRECASEILSSKKAVSKHVLPSDRCLRSGVSKGVTEPTTVPDTPEQTKLTDMHLESHERNSPDTKQPLTSKLKHAEETVPCPDVQYNEDVPDFNVEQAQQPPVVKQMDSMCNKVCTRQMVKEMESSKKIQEVPNPSEDLKGQRCVANTAAENETDPPQQSVKSPAKNSPGKSSVVFERMPLRNRNSQSENLVSTTDASSPGKNMSHTPERMLLRSRNSVTVDQPAAGDCCTSLTAAPVEETNGPMLLRNRNSGLAEPTVGKDSCISPNKSSVAHMPLRSRNSTAATEVSSDVVKDTTATITEEPSSSSVASKKIASCGHMPLRSGSGLVAEHSASLTSFGADAGTVSESPGRMSLRRSNTCADKLNCSPTLPKGKSLSPRNQKLSRTSELSVVQQGELNDSSGTVKTERLFNDQIKTCSISDPFNSGNLPTTGPLIPSPCKFLEALNGHANQQLISDLNSKFDKMQKGWVQMDKEGQPAPKPKNRADRLKEIWKSKRRTRKPRSVEQQKFSPVQMLFMKSFDLPNICRWFLQSTETKSLVIVKKVNTRLPSETHLGFHTLPSLPESCDGVFPSLQAERLKKHLKKFAIASPVKSNPKNRMLIAKALAQDLTKGKEKQEPRTATRISSKPQRSTGLAPARPLENHSKVAASAKNPASARILRKYSNMREKKQVQQNLKRTLEEVDNGHPTTKVSREKLSTRREQKPANARKVGRMSKKPKAPATKHQIPQAGGRRLRYLNKKSDVSQRRALARLLTSTPMSTAKTTGKKSMHLKAEMSPQAKTDIKKSPSHKSPESLMLKSQLVDSKPLSEDQVLTRSQRKMEATLSQTGSPRAATKRAMETSVTPAKRIRTSK